MKLAKIEIYKIVLLSIVTLGVYNYVWFAKRRNEIVAHYKLAIPHWWWLVAPMLVCVAATLALIATLFFAAWPYILIAMLVLTLTVLGFLPISIWWMVMFGQAAGRITNGRVPAGWTIAYWLLLGPTVTNIMLQFYFNKLTAKPAPAAKPTTRFIVVSCLLFSMVILLSIADSFYSTAFGDDFEETMRYFDAKNTNDIQAY